ncbi:matrix-remodeling-associated protein 5-like isoform X2 [Lethenteron reissneri]|uniref:matrix-remodeling-associated protein 5-like isoform X2 n=1 Tax=Lethenteron reissneri TaxID=7753 RepID=UPI002AB5ECED|nr:matrix-remodeling-associated protein 5-like isoform X2 [Lethenteron reissneri]
MAGMAVPWLLGAVLALLGSLPGAAGCPRACTCYVDTDVHCTFRYLHAVPPGLPGHVQRVNLGYNGILQLTEQSLPGLPHLEMLLLHSNSIQRLSGRVFQDLKSLTLLKLSHNKVRLLGREALRGLASLQRLHLDHNQLEFLHPEALVGLVSLRSLFLEGNRLRQLHRDSLVTFWLPPGRLLPASSLRQLHLSGNGLRSLPRGLFSSAGELEQVFLHDNPWACDCGLRWLLDWDRGGKELLKCKRERAQGGRLCPVCASPTANRGQELFTVPQEAVSCRRPSIASPLKLRNVSLWGDVGPDGPQGRPLGKVGLDLSDNGGNKGGLGCDALRPGGDGDGGRGAKLNVSEGRLSVRATIAVRLACAVEAGDMESLWRILAYYSDSPLVLRRERTFPGEREGSGPSYAQASDNGLGFFSGVRAAVSGDLPWLLDSEISLKLNRRLTSATKLYLDASVEIDVTYDLSDLPDKKSPWVMIGKEDAAESGLVVASGATLEIECQPWGFPNPGVLWTFPDGTRRPAPYDGPDGRVAVSADGTLTVRLAAASDRGVYRCVARADETSDAAAFRVEVVDGNVNERNANGAALTAARRQTLVLPCAATGSPDPEVAWVLPNKRVVRPSSSPSDGTYVTDNGTLVVPEVTEGGFYQCVAINKLGMERLVHKVEVTAASGEGGRVTNEIVESVETATPVASPTRARDELAAGRYIPREVTEGHVVTARAQLTTLGPSVATQGRREEPTSTTMETEDLDNNLDDDDDGDNEGERSVKTETKTLGSRNRPHSTLSRFGPGWWAKVLENVRNKISPRVRPTLSVLPHTKPPHTTSPARIEEKEEEEEEEEEKTEEEDNKDVTEEGGGRSRADDESTRGSDGRAEAENEESSADDVDVAVAKFNPNPTPQPPYPPTTRPGIVSVPRAVPSPPINRILTPEPLGEDSAMEPNYHLNSFSEGTDGQRAKWHDIRPTEKSETATAAHIEEEEEEKEEAKEEEEEATNSFHHEEMHTDRHHMQDPTARTASRENAARPYEPGVDELDGGGVVRDTFDSPRTDEPEAPTKSQAALPGDKRELAEATSVDGRTSSLGRHRPGGSEQPSSRGDSVETSKGGGGAGSEGGGMRTGAWGSAYDRTLGRSEEVERRQGAAEEAPSVTAAAGADAFLPCGSVGGGGFVDVRWIRASTGSIVAFSSAPSGRRVAVLRDGTLAVRSASPGDADRYTCETPTGGGGTGGATVALRVESRPPRVLSPRWRELRVSLGGTAEAECAAQGSPPPAISWTLPDHSSVAAAAAHHGGGRVSVSERATLTVLDVRPSDRGDYSCVARSAAGTDAITVRLHVLPVGPTVVRGAAAVSVAAGRPLSLPCAASGWPEPAVSWALPGDGGRLLPDRRSGAGSGVRVFANGTLLVPAVTRHDAGTYRCAAANVVGVDSADVLVTVLGPPRVAAPPPADVAVPYGGALRLRCVAEGEPQPVVVWRLPSGGTASMWFAADRRVRVLPDGSLALDGAVASDAGRYVCTVRNRYGEDSAAAAVSVTMRPARIERHSGDTRASGGGIKQSVRHGADLRFDCVTSGWPRPHVSWSLPDGAVVPADSRARAGGDGGTAATLAAGGARRYAAFGNGTLALRGVGPADGGDYTCYAENAVGWDAMVVRVAVEGQAPQIQDKPERAVVRITSGGSVALECRASGDPAPLVTWRLPDGSQLPPPSSPPSSPRRPRSSRTPGQEAPRRAALSVRGEDSALEVRGARIADAGRYVCVARNAAGEDSRAVRLDVLPAPPSINGRAGSSPEIKDSVAQGARKLLPCAADGDPRPHVVWITPSGAFLPVPHSSGRLLTHADGSLEIRSAARSDAGRYVCVARGADGGGDARLSVDLTVTGAPAPPSFLAPTAERAEVALGGSVALACPARGEPPPRTTWTLPGGAQLARGGTRGTRFSAGLDGALLVRGATPADAGVYRCSSRGPNGAADRAVLLEVGPRPRIAWMSGGTVAALAGDALWLHCVVAAGRASWRLPSSITVEVPGASGRRTLFANGTLAVRDSLTRDGGAYVCTARGAAGAAADGESRTVRVVVVAQAPRIVDGPPPAMAVLRGAPLRLPCTASGAPGPEVGWELPDGARLSTGTPAMRSARSGRYVLAGGTLVVAAAAARDAGFYRCSARNAVGEEWRRTSVRVV